MSIDFNSFGAGVGFGVSGKRMSANAKLEKITVIVNIYKTRLIAFLHFNQICRDYNSKRTLGNEKRSKYCKIERSRKRIFNLRA